MKTKTGLFPMVIFLAICLINFSCKKDTTSSSSSKNQITYKGTEYAMNKGYMVDYYGSMHTIELDFFSSGVTVYANGNVMDSLGGTGNGMYFDLINTDSTTLATGNYPYDSVGNYHPGTFHSAGFALNYNFSHGGGQIITVYGGTVSVKKTGTNYEISYSGMTYGGDPISLYYKGALNHYSY
ncbi:MAG: hypothetical protein NT040_14635 [Bacteroidetes bacterium]|nr:hypothetical protein [Bacteroidota bacterium]